MVLLLAVVSVSAAASGVTTYDVVVDGDTADMNITVELYPENPDRRTELTTSWLLPPGTTVRGVSDSDGELSYTTDGRQVEFTTTITPQEGKEVVTIRGTVDGVVAEEHRGLDLVQLRLSGFRDQRPDVSEEVTQVRVRTDRPVLSESHSFGFDAALGSHGANYSGEGPVNIRLAVSGQGERYDNFVLFGPGNLSTADDLYWVPVAVTGFRPQVNRWPVVVYSDEQYDQRVDGWSSGQYRTGGLIFIRNSTLVKDEGPAVVLHEVMHGFNADALRWTTANRAWFDEGTASYVEWLVNAKRGVRQAEIFGEEVVWREGRTRYTLPPRKTPGDLLTYYRENRTFMRDWTLFDTSVDRTFGYAYSELLIRRYVLDHGSASLRPVYSQLRSLNDRLDTAVESLHQSNQKILTAMETGFRPCYTTERDALEQCLEEVHRMEAEVPPLGDLAGTTEKVDIQPVDPPGEERTDTTAPGNRSTGDDTATPAQPGFLARLLGRLVAALASLF
ncbi:MAG: hypothetical protein SVU88_04260 [Candidatus Nanohaloarchaea archaeon]|nr:hypothetical protein [Candidatus Nanohaloarchaea archaeon]